MQEKIKLAFLRWMVRVAVRYKWRGKVVTDVTVDALEIASGSTRVPARRYAPRNAQAPLPVLLFFHGGGWVGFDLDTHDPLCRDLCARSGYLVISVDYRLAPEYPFPAGVHDCLDALGWLVQNAGMLGADPERIVVGGDSAGGNLAAVVALQARERYPDVLKGQVLIYPATDHPSAEWQSYVSCSGKGYPLSHVGLKDLWRMYTSNSLEWQPGQTQHHLATPYRVENLKGLPPALVLVAEDDLLRDEGLAYAQRMQDTGVPVSVKIFPGQKHGFVGLEPTPAHAAAAADIANWLRGVHGCAVQS